jgi:hypothetical protein
MSTSNRPTSAVLTAVVVIVLAGAVAMSGAVAGTQGFSLGGVEFPWATSDAPGNVVVEDAHAPSKIWTGDDLTLSVTVNNTGEGAATRHVEVWVDGDGDGTLDAAGNQSVTLEPGETTTLRYAIPTDESGTTALAPGSHEFRVTTGDDSLNGTLEFTILKPARVTVQETTVHDPLVAGTPGRMTATVENEGDFRAGRTVTLAVDADGDGSFEADEQFENASVNVDPRGTETVSLSVPTDELEPGTYTYRVAGRTNSVTGQFRILAPAAFQVTNVTAPSDAVRGETVNVTAVVTNTGDVTATKTVSVETNATGLAAIAPAANASVEANATDDSDANATADPGANATADAEANATADAAGASLSRTVTLDAGASTTVQFEATTANVSAGNYTVGVASPDHNATTTLRVREPRFVVTSLRTPDVDDIGDTYTFVGTVVNRGDATGTQTVDLRIDVDDDDAPESVGLNESVTLDAGEKLRVEIDMQTGYLYGEDRPTEDLDEGTYIYGFFTDDHNMTTTVTFREPSDGSSSSGRSDADGEETITDPMENNPYAVTRDEVSQTKYNRYYEELSGETKGQIDEVYLRQPFTGDLTMADVRTREEIARDRGYYDGDPHFVFHEEITIEQQQEVEKAFDAQFENEQGDSVESWEELAWTYYDTSFENLNEKQKDDVRDRYLDQF